MNISRKLGAFVAAGLISTLACAADHPETSVSPDEALAKLKEGNARFVAAKESSSKPTAVKRTETANGQHPFAVVVGCADSRTSPEIIFDQNIGDVFVIRTAGNVIDDHTLGSIEYAVEHLGVRFVVVMGHSKCGAVEAALAGETAPGHVQSLVRDIQPAVKAVKGKDGDPTALAVTENARLMAERVHHEVSVGDLAKDIKITSAVYDLASGKIDWANP